MAATATLVIAAAGSGQRLGVGGPKALVKLGGRPLVDWSIDAAGAASGVGEIVIAAPPDQVADFERDGARVVSGGVTRSESVAAAMELVETELVAVHDAARPLAAPELFDAVLGALADDPDAAGVVAATRVTDTIKEVARGDEVDSTLDRSRLWAVQTPQAFRSEALRDAQRSTELLAQATDDASLLERLGMRILVCEAPAENLKVTSPVDLRMAELLLSERAGS